MKREAFPTRRTILDRGFIRPDRVSLTLRHLVQLSEVPNTFLPIAVITDRGEDVVASTPEEARGAEVHLRDIVGVPLVPEFRD